MAIEIGVLIKIISKLLLVLAGSTFTLEFTLVVVKTLVSKVKPKLCKLQNSLNLPFEGQPHKMVIHTEAIRTP